jgi:branched-chain amino acid transport system substrate-binding protein
MKNICFSLLCVLCLAGLILSGGCKKEEHSSTQNQPIKIGVMLALTGDSANYGKRSLNGITWAAEKIKMKGGINGKDVELVVEDDQSSPKSAVTVFNKLIDVDKVTIVVGDIISGTTMAVVPIADKKHILLFAPGASNPKLRETSANTSPVNYVFRDWTSDDFDGKAMAGYLLKQNVKMLGLIVQKTDYTIGLASALVRDFETGGGQIIIRQDFETSDTDLRTQIINLKAANVNNVYISAYSPGTGLILKQASQLGFPPQWYATLTVDTPECGAIAGSARNGVIFTTPAFNVDDQGAVMKEFVTGFKARFNDDPEVVAAHAYDALNILAMLIGQIGDSPDILKDALYKVQNYNGASGVMTFDNNGDVTKAIYIKQYVSGSPVVLKNFQP